MSPAYFNWVFFIKTNWFQKFPYHKFLSRYAIFIWTNDHNIRIISWARFRPARWSLEDEGQLKIYPLHLSIQCFFRFSVTIPSFESCVWRLPVIVRYPLNKYLIVSIIQFSTWLMNYIQLSHRSVLSSRWYSLTDIAKDLA